MEIGKLVVYKGNKRGKKKSFVVEFDSKNVSVSELLVSLEEHVLELLDEQKVKNRKIIKL